LDAVRGQSMGVLVITHYNRLLAELTPDVVHVFAEGRVVHTGGPELALELERTGYEPYLPAKAAVSAPDDPFADPFA
jgi:Fe-S cluster assembly ATP-binding protein